MVLSSYVIDGVKFVGIGYMSKGRREFLKKLSSVGIRRVMRGYHSTIYISDDGDLFYSGWNQFDDSLKIKKLSSKKMTKIGHVNPDIRIDMSIKNPRGEFIFVMDNNKFRFKNGRFKKINGFVLTNSVY